MRFTFRHLGLAAFTLLLAACGQEKTSTVAIPVAPAEEKASTAVADEDSAPGSNASSETMPPQTAEEKAVASTKAAPAPVVTESPEEPVVLRPERTGPSTWQLGDITIDAETREVRIPGVVNAPSEQYLEYAIVHEMGKIHEALLTTKAMPFHVQMALVLLDYEAYTGDLFEGFERDNGGESLPDSAKAKNEIPADKYQLQIELQWTDRDGKEHRNPLADLMYRPDRKQAMPTNTVWHFIGLRVLPGNPYRPDMEKSLAAVYLDPFSLLNYASDGNRSDESWVVHPENTPEEGTEVIIVLRSFAHPSSEKK